MRVRSGRSWAGRWSGNLDPVPDPWAVRKVIGSLEGRRTLRGAATASGSGGFEGIGAGIEAVGSSVTHERDPRKGGSTPGNRPGSVAVDPVRPLFGAVADLTPEALRKLASRVSLPPDIVKRAEALADGGAVALTWPGRCWRAWRRRGETVGGCGPARIRRAGGRHGGRPGGCGLWRGRNERRGRLERRCVYCGASRPLESTHPLRTAPNGPPEESRSSWPPIVRSHERAGAGQGSDRTTLRNPAN